MNKTVFAMALLLAAAVLAAGWLVLNRWHAGFDLSEVALAGDLDARQQESVAAALRERRNEIEDIGDVQRVISSLNWVHEALVMRRWPDGLVIEVRKEMPIAWWNDDAFINAEGRVFTSPHVDLSSIPQLYGPSGTETEVMAQYQSLAKALTRVDQSIDTLRLDERGSWQFETNDGIKVMLGKDNIMDRVQRFLLVVERVGLADRMDDIEKIDARYSNGLAVSWVEVPPGSAIAGSGAYVEAHSEKTKRETRL